MILQWHKIKNRLPEHGRIIILRHDHIELIDKPVLVNPFIYYEGGLNGIWPDSHWAYAYEDERGLELTKSEFSYIYAEIHKLKFKDKKDE